MTPRLETPLALIDAMRKTFHDPDEGTWAGHSTEDENCTACERAAFAAAQFVDSWAGLMHALDTHWPADVFPAREDDGTGDAGPRIIALIRLLDEARRERDDFRGRLALVQLITAMRVRPGLIYDKLMRAVKGEMGT